MHTHACIVSLHTSLHHGQCTQALLSRLVCQHQVEFDGNNKTSVLLPYSGASLVAQLVKNLPAMQKTLARFLGQEDPLEKG